MECAAASGFDVKQLDISGRPRLFRVDDSLVQQLKLCGVRLCESGPIAPLQGHVHSRG